MVPLCRDEGIGILPWSPLARGFLMGNRTPEHSGETVRARTDDYAHGLYYRDSDFEVVERVTGVARALGVSNAQVGLAWLLRQEGVVAPVVGATRMEHLDDAVAALDLDLGDDEVRSLEEPYRTRPVMEF